MKLAALIGDIVESKHAADREALQHLLLDVLKTINQNTHPTTALRITRGDEFEGAYATLAAAWEATLRLRLMLRAQGHDVWTSVAWGEVTTLPHAADPAIQDGPVWWTAREALTNLKQSSRHKTPDNRRTVFVTPTPNQSLLETATILRDEVIAGLDQSDSVITLGLLDGATQASIAETLGVTAGVVSRRAHRNGLLSLASSAKIDP